MKQLLILSAMIAAISVPVQAAAATINASEVLGTYGTFLHSPATAGLNEVVTDDFTSTYVKSNDDNAYIELGFGSNQIVSGSDADFVIYTVGNAYSFGLQVFGGANDAMLSSYEYDVPADGSSTLLDENGLRQCLMISGICEHPISATAINLFDLDKNEIADGVNISRIRVYLGNDYNGVDLLGYTAQPVFSLATALHTATPVTAVPLPLSAILFSSGLALLGWVGRKKRA